MFSPPFILFFLVIFYQNAVGNQPMAFTARSSCASAEWNAAEGEFLGILGILGIQFSGTTQIAACEARSEENQEQEDRISVIISSQKHDALQFLADAYITPRIGHLLQLCTAHRRDLGFPLHTAQMLVETARRVPL